MIFHYEFHCKNCKGPIVLHAETLGRPFEPQGIQTNSFHSLAVPCFLCKRVEIYSPDRSSPHHDKTLRVVSPAHVAETEFLGLLECDDKDRKSTRLNSSHANIS